MSPYRHHALTASVFALVTACTPGQREGARTVLDGLNFACVIANQLLGDAKVAEICGVTEPYRDTMRDILSSARAETSKAVSAARSETMAAARAQCPPSSADGGAR